MTRAASPGAPARIVLVGAGHAHLVFLSKARNLAGSGASITLIDPGLFHYSGTATAVLEGRLPPDSGSVDPAGLCKHAGVRLVRERAVRVDRPSRHLHTAEGETIPYDLLSINTGSRVRLPIESDGSIPEASIKPIRALQSFRESLLARVSQNGKALTIAVIGGGPSGCEIAVALASLAVTSRLPIRVHLLHSGHLLGDSFPRSARKRTAARLRRLEVSLHPARARAIRAGRILLEKGPPLPCDQLVWATGLAPQIDIVGLEACQDPDGAIEIGPTLQSPVDPAILACGDCAAFLPRRLPRIGVYGVRQGAHLARMLPAFLAGKPLPRFVPQRHALLILNLGAGTGLAVKGPFSFQGRCAWLWKNALDQAFLKGIKTESGDSSF